MFLKKNSYYDSMEFITGDITLTKIVAGLVIIGVGILLGYILGKLSRKILESFEIRRLLRERGVKFPLIDLLSSITKFIVYILAVTWGVFQMHIEIIVLLVVAIFVAILIVWRVITVLIDFIPNYIAMLSLNLKKGRTVTAGETKGKILERGIIETKIKTQEGEELYVPNRLFKK